jgi:protein-S-isoprenylcysteine O-methyltransferase Ste14
MTTSGISDQESPDSTKTGAWLFRHRTALPVPFAVALLLVPAGDAAFSRTLIISGVILTAAGELIRLWAVHHIGVISRTRSERLGPLVESGPFGLVRNPLYLGNILLWVGFTLTAGMVWMAPIALALLAFEYHAIVRWEEGQLDARFGEAYRTYANKVPRWIPTIASVSVARSAATAFSWSDTLFSERGTLIAIAAGYALLWLKARS